MDSEKSKKDKNNESSSELEIKVETPINTRKTLPNPNSNQQITPGTIPFPLQFPFNDLDRSMYPQMYYNPFLAGQPMIPPTFNYLGNQGIFIPQTTENNHFFFIPGNIIANPFNEGIIPHDTISKNIPDTENVEVNNIKNSDYSANIKKDALFFIPTFENNDEVSGNTSTYDTDKFETFLVPVKITKELNGNIELSPEQNNENQQETTNPEQLNILRKINHLKNQQITKAITNSIENNVSEHQDIIDNIQDKTHGYAIFRLNKDKIQPNEVEIEKSTHITPIVQNALIISAAEKGKRRIKNKKRQKTHKLKLAAVSDKLSTPAQSTSRFRRLRIDDRTQCWNMSSVSCIDTRVKELPTRIITLAETNSIIIPDGVFNIFKQQEITTNANKESKPTCEHGMAQDSRDKQKKSEKNDERSPFSFWRYMCSMNNCEFIPQEKELI